MLFRCDSAEKLKANTGLDDLSLTEILLEDYLPTWKTNGVPLSLLRPASTSKGSAGSAAYTSLTQVFEVFN